MSGRQVLKEVNLKYNKFKYITDEDNYGLPDYWATPEEFLAMGGGDCEDYAIVKGQALLDTKQFTEGELEVVIVFDMMGDGYHAVLRVRGVSILDNQTNEVYPFLVPWHRELYAVPYSVFRQGRGMVKKHLEEKYGG